MAQKKQDNEAVAVDIHTMFAVNVDAEVTGVWTDDFVPGLDVLVARIGNKEYQRVLAFEGEEERKRSGVDALDTEQNREVILRTMAKTIWLGWRGLMYKGEVLEYTAQNALMILSDPEMHDFTDRIYRLAQESDKYLKSREDSDAGN